MSEEGAPVDLVFLWHHHQPDYRRPRDGRSVLPWVRLHATKDYLDMARRLEAHPEIHSAFNFVPSLLDQIEAAVAGSGDVLFDLLARPVGDLTGGQRERLVDRCAAVPRHALERWIPFRNLHDRLLGRSRGARGGPSDADLLALEVWFLLAWLDPMFLREPEARAAAQAMGNFSVAHRDGLLALHARLLAEVIPAYRRLAESGQVELTESPYYHPILPLLVDVQSALRARPEMALPLEKLSAPEDAVRQVENALERHARVFGSRPRGMWPAEGSVSPEAVEIVRRAGVQWLATDEGVLWQSLPKDARRRELLYRPWRWETPAGEVALFFRDHELSDRIGFVYHHWRAEEAVADFIGRVRRIGREHLGDRRPVVSVILDGENCWEYYSEDGGPFLEALYFALEQASDIRTRTPSEVLADSGDLPRLARLHSGSWIDADFRIWIGHPEKNRAWDLLARARSALADSGRTPEAAPRAWESLWAAEGSDWYWWFGDDHYTSDKPLFDKLFRDHLQGVYEGADLTPPGWLQVPISGPVRKPDAARQPVKFIHPVLDGRRTSYYEWHGAGRHRLGAGGSAMHRTSGLASDLHYGFDAERFYFRLDFASRESAGPDFDLVLEFLIPNPVRIRVAGLQAGERPVTWDTPERQGTAVEGAQCEIGRLLELGVPFASLGLAVGDPVEVLGMLFRDGAAVETVPPDDVIRFAVPDETFEASMWSA